MNDKITESYRLQYGYGEIVKFTESERLIKAIEECTEFNAQTYLSSKRSYGKLLSIFKTMPFKVVIIALYGRTDKAAEEWRKYFDRNLRWFGMLDIINSIGEGEKVNDETARFVSLAQKFIMIFRKELKDYLIILCDDYDPCVASKSFKECIKEHKLSPFIWLAWQLKFACIRQRCKNRVRYFLKRKNYDSYNNFCVKQSAVYRKYHDMIQRLDERDKQMKKGYGF